MSTTDTISKQLTLFIDLLEAGEDEGGDDKKLEAALLLEEMCEGNGFGKSEKIDEIIVAKFVKAGAIKLFVKIINGHKQECFNGFCHHIIFMAEQLIFGNEETANLFLDQGLVPAIMGCIESHPGDVWFLTSCLGTFCKLFCAATDDTKIFRIAKETNLLEIVTCVMEEHCTYEKRDVKGSAKLYDFACMNLLTCFFVLLELTEEKKKDLMSRIVRAALKGLDIYPDNKLAQDAGKMLLHHVVGAEKTQILIYHSKMHYPEGAAA
jgi:hypothetical protein